MIVSCLSRTEKCARKKAVVALSQIVKKGRRYIELAVPIPSELSEIDPDESVRSEAKKTLESIREGWRSMEA